MGAQVDARQTNAQDQSRPYAEERPTERASLHQGEGDIPQEPKESGVVNCVARGEAIDLLGVDQNPYPLAPPPRSPNQILDTNLQNLTHHNHPKYASRPTP